MSSLEINIREVVLPSDLPAVSKLWYDYLCWGNSEMQRLYGVHPHIPKEAVAHDIAVIDKFLPPSGRLVLAVYNEKPYGLGSLKRIDDDTGEIKRMYVSPAFRNIGAGRAILTSLITEAKKVGYKRIRLDSPRFMTAAHALYRSFGFREIGAYPEAEIPADFAQHLVFMELQLK